ncbi:PKD domain-containing protein [Nannocystis sp. SCPEA4]|uniref:PKD domain-containing protein n=1 Tax=Nannocystis sp. SCPEA4 TaxID=2996787 RepID=UPI00227033D1|nr:PKD domain-containing protein [Nannocystis sp. SCPEA4]MCY1060229.1 PKD domain-containing protein [Nannocystis sp. SCPEA4]
MARNLAIWTCLFGLITGGCPGPGPAASTGTSDGEIGTEMSSGTADDSSSGTDATGTTTAVPTTTEAPTSGTTGPDGPLHPDPGEPRYVLIGEAVVLDGSASTGAVLYQWDPGDGSPASEPSADPVFMAMYAEPGRYKPILTVYDGQGGKLSASVTITATKPAVWQPRHSSTVVQLGEADAVAVVSADSDEVMIAEWSGDEFAVARRIATAAGPRTVSDMGEWIAVAAQDAGVLEFRRWDGGDAGHALALGHGSRPFGVVAAGTTVYAALQGPGRLAVVEFDGQNPPVLQDMIEVGFDARGVTLLPDGRVAVTRWRSPPSGGEVSIVDVAQGEVVETWPLQFDPQQASDTEVGGVPSYLSQVAVSPTADLAALPALQVNVMQGLFLNGQTLDPDQVMRAIVAYVALPAGAEQFERRKQFDNRGLASAAAFSPRGDYLYVATRGPQTVERVDVFSGDSSGNLFKVGYAPEGLAVSRDGRWLFVDASLSRELVVYDTGVFDSPGPAVARLQIPSSEPLAPAVLRGKQLFNDSEDDRLSKDDYIACAHCHLDGESDLQVWDFSERGEGLRDTAALLGHAGLGDGPIHWSANFDEVQDFEHDIRGGFGGAGLLDDADWEAGTHSQTLGDPKAGLSEDLDALAAYLATLTEEPTSPFRGPLGELTPEAELGRTLFESDELACTTCHKGQRLTDSQWVDPGVPLLHDVGTLGPGSGQRLGMALTGLDTPTLHGLWRTPPYLHDGSAATLGEVLGAKNPDDLHGVTSALDDEERAALVAYLLCLDGQVD